MRASHYASASASLASLRAQAPATGKLGLATNSPAALPKLAADAPRLAAVREAFAHSWSLYREVAWGRDTVKPLSRSGEDALLGMATSLVDSLDTLAIMGFEAEFAEVGVRCWW